MPQTRDGCVEAVAEGPRDSQTADQLMSRHRYNRTAKLPRQTYPHQTFTTTAPPRSKKPSQAKPRQLFGAVTSSLARSLSRVHAILTGMSSLAWPDATRLRLCRSASRSFWEPWYLTMYRAGQNLSSSLAQLSSTELGTTTRCGRLLGGLFVRFLFCFWWGGEGPNIIRNRPC